MEYIVSIFFMQIMFYNKRFLFLITFLECALLLRWPFQMSNTILSIPNIIIPFSVVAFCASCWSFFEMSMFGHYGKSHDVWIFCIFCRKMAVLLYYIRTQPFFSLICFILCIQMLFYLITDQLLKLNRAKGNSVISIIHTNFVQIVEYMFNIIIIFIMLKSKLRICFCVLICKYIFLEKNTRMYAVSSNLYLLTMFTSFI